LETIDFMLFRLAEIDVVSAHIRAWRANIQLSGLNRFTGSSFRKDLRKHHRNEIFRRYKILVTTWDSMSAARKRKIWKTAKTNAEQYQICGSIPPLSFASKPRRAN